MSPWPRTEPRTCCGGHHPRVNTACRPLGTAPGWHVQGGSPRVGPAGTGTPAHGSTPLFHDATLGGKGQVCERRGAVPGKEGGAGQGVGRKEGGPAEEGGAEQNRGSLSSYHPKKSAKLPEIASTDSKSVWRERWEVGMSVATSRRNRNPSLLRPGE